MAQEDSLGGVDAFFYLFNDRAVVLVPYFRATVLLLIIDCTIGTLDAVLLGYESEEIASLHLLPYTLCSLNNFASMRLDVAFCVPSAC